MKQISNKTLALKFMWIVIITSGVIPFVSAEYVGWQNVDYFYLKYSFNGSMVNNETTYGLVEVSQILNDHYDHGGEKIDLLNFLIEFNTNSSKIYDVYFHLQFINYSYSGYLKFSKETYQFYNIDDVSYTNGVYGLFLIPLHSHEEESTVPICNYDVRGDSAQLIQVNKDEFSERKESSTGAYNQNSQNSRSKIYYQQLRVEYPHPLGASGEDTLKYNMKYDILLEGGIFDSLTILLDVANVRSDDVQVENSFRLYDTNLDLMQVLPMDLSTFFLIGAIAIIVIPGILAFYIKVQRDKTKKRK